MTRIISALIAAWAIALLFLPSPVLAVNLSNGAKVFSANCASCHIKGGNLVNPSKTLKSADLEKFDMASLDAIKTQVTNGKAAMPAFKGRLTDEQIEDVANYVLSQAEKDWS